MQFSVISNSTDKGNYCRNLTNAAKKNIIDAGPCRPVGPFKLDKNNRSFSTFYYTIRSKSGIVTHRMWLCYSSMLDKCYCQPCWLFARGVKTGSFADGFNDWVHLNQALKRHEASEEHNTCCAISDKWKMGQTIDVDEERVTRETISKWAQILERVINVSLMLALCNMPFRGNDESDDAPNPGCFLSVIKLLSKYDSVLLDLLEKRQKRSITYLSPTIQNEIINLLGNAGINNVVSQ